MQLNKLIKKTNLKSVSIMFFQKRVRVFGIIYCNLFIISLRSTGLYCPGNEMLSCSQITLQELCLLVFVEELILGRIFLLEHTVIARNSVFLPFYASCQTALLYVILKITVMASACHLASA